MRRRSRTSIFELSSIRTPVVWVKVSARLRSFHATPHLILRKYSTRASLAATFCALYYTISVRNIASELTCVLFVRKGS